MTKHLYDVAIIGGGINGCGAAADAALRGLSVVLCEKGDLASQTSSSSTKLIHGGLRYLEQFDFSLTRKALTERQLLLDMAPHLVHPLQFVLPQQQSTRKLWLLRMGLFIYDHLGRHNRLPRSSLVTRLLHPELFKPLIPAIEQGFVYYDCMTDDARLTMANALQAKEHGATIHTETEVISTNIVDSTWQLNIRTKNQDIQCIHAKTIINATGPWVAEVNHLLNIPNAYKLALVKGSHLVLKQLYEGSHAYVLQNDDKRIIFTIPYFGYTLLGTTDVPYTGDLNEPAIDAIETSYLLDVVEQYFGVRPTPDDIITSWSGIRPLLFEDNKNASALTRDYHYHFSTEPAPAVTIYGGKITTYRLLAEKVVDQLKTVFPNIKPSSTHTTPLPGAGLNAEDYMIYQKETRQIYAWLDEKILDHYLQTYGTRSSLILNGCECLNDLGEHFMGTLYQCEVDYLMNEEWATTEDDVLWRRSKLGLEFHQKNSDSLTQYMKKHASGINSKR